jgi:phosphohistidine phosphatase
MRLLVVRHADAEPTRTTDADRRLTGKGRGQADRLANYLKGIGLTPGRVVTSPYLRAVETAQPIVETAGGLLVEDSALAPGMAPEDAAAVLAHECDPDETVVLVGHQPDLGELCAWLMGLRDSDALAMKKGVLAVFSLAHPRAGEAVLQAFLPPKLLP